MVGDKHEQHQNSGDGGNALQAGRDIHYHGLSVSEVKDLCTLFLRNEFPKLREDARLLAEQHVQEFSKTLEDTLVQRIQNIVMDKFKDPDVQVAINDAVQASARRGKKANPNILAALVAERVSSVSSNFKDIVINEAVKTTDKLTLQQISLLSFIHFVVAMKHGGLTSLDQMEPYGQTALAFSKPGFNLSETQIMHMVYCGACTLSPFAPEGRAYIAWADSRCRDLYSEDASEFKTVLKKQAPSCAALLDKFEEKKCGAINLTSVGQAIALANISNYFGPLDYSIWIK